MDKIKHFGKIYTPQFIVRDMLDLCGYSGINILNKHVMENSCGDGAFLIEILNRYCTAFLSVSNNDIKKLKSDLETYIHGIEIDQDEVKKCRDNLDAVAKNFGVDFVDWDVNCNNTLVTDKYDGSMDFVVGNPPYVRVHNLTDYTSVKKFSFAKTGMTDLYIVFYEIGFRMLSKTGKMCLITPSSFLQSNAGQEFRQYIQRNKNLEKIIDMGTTSVFDASAYTVITLFGNKSETVEYKKYDDSEFSRLSYDDIFSNGKMVFDKPENLELLDKINCFYKSRSDRSIIVKNGFATLSDKIFIGDFKIQDEFIINILKASTGEWKKCIYPYYFTGLPTDEQELKDKHKEVYDHLFENKTQLLARDIESENNWFLFGRTQGLRDTFRNKIAINTIIKDIASIKLNIVPQGSGVYSGLYILSDYSYEQIHNVVYNNDFINYLQILKKYKNGGYYTFSSMDLEKYLVYKLKGGDNERFKSNLFAKIG